MTLLRICFTMDEVVGGYSILLKDKTTHLKFEVTRDNRVEAMIGISMRSQVQKTQFKILQKTGRNILIQKKNQPYFLHEWCFHLERPDPGLRPGYPGPKSDPDPWAGPGSKTSPNRVKNAHFLGQNLPIFNSFFHTISDVNGTYNSSISI